MGDLAPLTEIPIPPDRPLDQANNQSFLACNIGVIYWEHQSFLVHSFFFCSVLSLYKWKDKDGNFFARTIFSPSCMEHLSMIRMLGVATTTASSQDIWKIRVVS